MSSFNLKSYLIKEAMGARAYRYRDQIHWNRIEDVIKGQAVAVVEIGSDDNNVKQKTWEELRKEMPSLNGAIYEILDFKAEREAFFQARYGIPKDDVRDIFQVFVGYHPFYGCYALSVGPYCASASDWKVMSLYSEEKGHTEILPEDLEEAISNSQARLAENKQDATAAKLLSAAKSIKADKSNRFGAFIRRFQRATVEEISSAAKKYITAITKVLAATSDVDVKDVLNPETDFQIAVKSASGEKPKTNLKFKQHTYKTLSPNTEDGSKLIDKKPLIGRASLLSLNANGLHKLMLATVKSGGLQGIYDQALQIVAQAEKISPENAEAVVNSDIDLMKQVIKKAREIQDDLIKSGNPMAKSMKKIPPFDLIKPKKVGSQRFDALRTRTDQEATARLKLEVLEACNQLQSQDPVKIANLLQSKRDSAHLQSVMGKGRIDPATIKPFINQIKAEQVLRGKNGRKINVKTFKQLLSDAQKDLNFIVENKGSKFNEGFSDLESCYRGAQLYLYSPGADAVDPASKAKVSALFMPAPDLLYRDKSDQNPTSSKLEEMRQQARLLGTESEMLNNVRVASPSEMFLELGGEPPTVVTEETPDKKEMEEPEDDQEKPIPDKQEQKDKQTEFKVEDILKVKDQYLAYVEQINSETEYAPNPTVLCNYCDFQNLCPAGKAKAIDSSNIYGEVNW
jgi:hypothetical protein